MPKLLRATIGAAITSFALISTTQAQVANDMDTLALAAILDNNSFDRAQLMIANQMQFWQPVLDTLLVMQTDGTIVPSLATDWAYNEDNSILTLKLREGVSFTDGAPFDSEAVKANLDYLKNGAGQNSFMMEFVSEIELVSPGEVRLHLSEPDPTLIDNLTVVGGAMASPASLTGNPAATLVGTGPYVYDTATSVIGRQYVYTRNADYWDAAAFPFERITITPMNDQVARLNAIKSGQVDAGLGEARTVVDAEANGLKVHKSDVNWLGITIADRNGTLAPALADVRVRQAINMAFDTPSILKFVELGFGRLSDQIFPTGSEAYVPELDEFYAYAPEGAKVLLAEAGYPDGFEVTMPELAAYSNFNPIIEQQLGAVGIKVKWEKVAPNATIPELRSGKYPLFILNFGYQGSWAEYRKFTFADSAWNPFASVDPTFSEMLDDVQYRTGDDQIEGYRELNRYMVENAFFAPWYRRDTIYLTNAETEVSMRATNAVPHIRDYRKLD